MRIDHDRLALTQELQALVIDYWHDVDTNWGHNAPNYYMPDGEFIGSKASYKGREKIRAFYKWREDRGARTVIHAVHNFQAMFDGAPDKALCHWFLMLYAADGTPILPSAPPIQIAYMTDNVVHTSDGWLVSKRQFEEWFIGGIPTTNPNLDDT
jgi:SnoaL-like domain